MEKIQIFHIVENSNAFTDFQKNLGYTFAVMSFADFENAWKIVGTQLLFRAFILDYNYDPYKAFNLIRYIRKKKCYRKTPIIMLAENPDNNLCYQAMVEGVNKTVSRSIDTRALSDLVTELIDDPVVTIAMRSSIDVECIKYCINNTFYEFCPELNLTVSARTEEMAVMMMVDTLKKEIPNIGHKTFHLHNIKAKTHNIKLDS